MRLRVVGYQVQVRLRTLLPCFHKAHIENLALMVVGVVFAQSFSLPAVLTGFKTCCGKLARSFTFFRRAGAGSPKGHRATRLHQVSSGTAQDATPRRVAGERDNVSDAVCAEEDDVPADTESRRRVSKCWSRLCKLRVGAVRARRRTRGCSGARANRRSPVIKGRRARPLNLALGIQLSRLYSSKRPSSAASARFGAFAGMKLRTKPKA